MLSRPQKKAQAHQDSCYTNSTTTHKKVAARDTHTHIAASTVPACFMPSLLFAAGMQACNMTQATHAGSPRNADGWQSQPTLAGMFNPPYHQTAADAPYHLPIHTAMTMACKKLYTGTRHATNHTQRLLKPALTAWLSPHNAGPQPAPRAARPASCQNCRQPSKRLHLNYHQ